MWRRSHENDQPYQPFKYPPDYQLARVHRNSSMPGKPSEANQQCPCCNVKVKTKFKSWWDRSIQRDFGSLGGGVVGYFWLLKLYSLAIIIIIITYGGYLQYLTNYYCSIQNQNQKCGQLYGLWVVTNKDLQNLISQRNDSQALIRFYTLRGILLLILLIVNSMSLYLIKWFRVRYPENLSVVDFSLLFKNVKNDTIDGLLSQLREQFGKFQVREAFLIKSAQPYYSTYQKKLSKFYACKIEANPKKLKKLRHRLQQLNKLCKYSEDQFDSKGSRAIIVFEDSQVKTEILNKYKISKCKTLQMICCRSYAQKFRMYCQKAPKLEQIIWKNIGTIEKHDFRMKLLSVIYFVFLISFYVGFLYYFIDTLYVQPIIEPLKSIITAFILILIVILGLIFRMLMSKLSNMRNPKTYTTKAIFTIKTTVVFHVIFYLFVPSLYLYFHEPLRGATLSLISSQVVSFIAIQMILSAFDWKFFKWNRARATFEDQSKPIGCQKILHSKMEYPRFPIEVKLIVLFKIWSFITFFAFQVPLILFILLFVLIFLYIKDKMNVYSHYRMEMIDCQTEFKFLKLYSNIFSLYVLLTFLSLQNDLYQMIIGGAGTLLVMLFQTFCITDPDEQQSRTSSFVAPKLSSLEHVDSYSSKYRKFIDEAYNDDIDCQINEYLQVHAREKRQKQTEYRLID